MLQRLRGAGQWGKGGQGYLAAWGVRAGRVRVADGDGDGPHGCGGVDVDLLYVGGVAKADRAAAAFVHDVHALRAVDERPVLVARRQPGDDLEAAYAGRLGEVDADLSDRREPAVASRCRRTTLGIPEGRPGIVRLRRTERFGGVPPND